MIEESVIINIYNVAVLTDISHKTPQNKHKKEIIMTEKYIPPKVWNYKENNSGKFSSINKPTAGARKQKTLPVGEHPFQLYSMGTPNGVKVTIMFEELLELGIKEAEYDAFLINIMEGDQFDSGFVDINPNSKIPAMLDKIMAIPFTCLSLDQYLCTSQKSLESFCQKILLVKPK